MWNDGAGKPWDGNRPECAETLHRTIFMTYNIICKALLSSLSASKTMWGFHGAYCTGCLIAVDYAHTLLAVMPSTLKEKGKLFKSGKEMYFIPEIVLMLTIQMQFLPGPAQRNGARALYYSAERYFFPADFRFCTSANKLPIRICPFLH